jgi:hypothetical protein
MNKSNNSPMRLSSCKKNYHNIVNNLLCRERKLFNTKLSWRKYIIWDPPHCNNCEQSLRKSSHRLKYMRSIQYYFIYIWNLRDNTNVLIWNLIESINFLIHRSVKMFSAVKGKIEKSVFDAYLFDEIFFDTQKIH